MKTLILLVYFSGLYDVVWMESENSRTFAPEWSDLDTRTLPSWYDCAKIGILIHWGLYSVPGIKSEWFWIMWTHGDEEISKYMKKFYSENFEYRDFAPMFTAELYNPNDWAELFNKSGAKYVVLTAKHHDGYALFPSSTSQGFNSVDVGPNIDIVKTLSDAVRQYEMKFGVYYSLYEWYNPAYITDRENNFSSYSYPQSKMWFDIKQLVFDYKPSILWSDGDWEAPPSYWKSKDLIAWLYNFSPVKHEIVVNDRWGKGTRCKHGDFNNCDKSKSLGRKWENVFSLHKNSWGYRRDFKISDIMTLTDLLKKVVSTVSSGGNVLISIGPTKEGTILPIFQERLLQLGEWLQINGEAIYSTSPWIQQQDNSNPNIWYTCGLEKFVKQNAKSKPVELISLNAVYVIFFGWPVGGMLRFYDEYIYNQTDKIETVQLLGLIGHADLSWSAKNGEFHVRLMDLTDESLGNPQPAWTVKITFKFIPMPAMAPS